MILKSNQLSVAGYLYVLWQLQKETKGLRYYSSADCPGKNLTPVLKGNENRRKKESRHR